jgi:hypothetical protein
MGLQFLKLNAAHELTIKTYLQEELLNSAKALKEQARKEGVSVKALTSRLLKKTPDSD